MNSFFKFVVSVLLAGMALNLLIVFFANASSTRRLDRQMADERRQFQSTLETANGRLRRADCVVESQSVDAHGNATSSSLLIRQYASPGSDQSLPLHIQRVTIPGNDLYIDGLVLSFGDSFAADSPDLQLLQNRTLAYFARVFGKDQIPTSKDADTRYTFLQAVVPDLTRLFPSEAHPTFFEQRLWPYVWNIVKEPPLEGDNTWSPATHGIKFLWTAPAHHPVRLDHTYSAFIGPDGSLSIEEDSMGGMPDLLNAMLDAGKKQLAEAAAAAQN